VSVCECVCVCADVSARMLSAPVALTPACSGKGPLFFQARSRLFGPLFGRLVTLGGVPACLIRGVCEAGGLYPVMQPACRTHVQWRWEKG
jgi:hypothetical protein